MNYELDNIEMTNKSFNEIKFLCSDCGGIVEPIDGSLHMTKIYELSDHVKIVDKFNKVYGFKCTSCGKYYKVDLNIEITDNEE